MQKPTNTTQTSPEVHLLDAMVRGPSKSIEHMEAQGQRELVQSQCLPADCDRAAVENLGIKLGEPFPEDNIFCPAEFPEGWKIRATDHSMWTELVDDKDKVRASIFYKAASYDRSAFMRIDD